MPNESFLQRWSRLKAAPAPPQPVEPPPVPAAAVPHAVEAQAAPLPTLEDAARLDAGSDYSAFVARGVDSSVRRLAMKKLFADPHFNLIDGLDIYMGDYNVPSPVSEAMLASLSHARNIFARIDEALEPQSADAPARAEPAAQANPPTEHQVANEPPPSCPPLADPTSCAGGNPYHL